MAPARIPPPQIGWPLLPLPDAEGKLAFPGLEASVRQSIEVLLRTRPGEQLMQPELGGGLDELLHQPNTLATRRRMRDLVLETLERWEDRILVDRVEVWEVPEKPAEVRVELAYRLRRSGAAQELGIRLEMTERGE